MWKPASLEEMNKAMEWADAILSLNPDCHEFWKFIRIEPEKWQENTMGAEGGGFWVVGIMGKTVIYYNDIEDGYNRSPFQTYGHIDEYICGQLELHELISSIFEQIKSTK